MMPRVMFVLDSTRFALAALALAVIGGCAQTNPRAAEPDPRPGVAGAQSGIELQWWSVDDSNNALGRTLAQYADRPVPMHDSVRQLWKENGLRVVSVPVEELNTMRADVWRAGRALRLDESGSISDPGGTQGGQSGITRVHEEWLGQRPRWTEIASGREMPQGAVLALDSGRVKLGPGRVRMLARCWSIPLTGLSTRVPAGLRLELALQWADTNVSRSRQPSLDKISITRAAEDQGLIFTRFVAEMIAVEGEALVFVADAPKANWNKAPDDESQALALPAVTMPTLGQALLGDPGVGEYRSSVKVIVVLTPRIPEHYELIQR